MTKRLRPGGWWADRPRRSERRAARWVMPALALLWAVAIAVIAAPRLLVGVKGTVESLSAGWGHPLPANLLANWGTGLAVFALVSAMGVCAWLSGSLLGGLLRMGSRDARGPLAFGPLGYGACSMSLLGLLMTRLWFVPLLLATLLLPAAAALARRSHVIRGSVSRDLRGLFPKDAPFLVAVVLLAFLVTRMLAPETQLDAWTYSLAGPERWLKAHGLSVVFADYRMHFPMLAELPFAIPLVFGLDQAGAWLSLALYLCGAGAVLLMVPRKGRGWGLFLMTAVPTVGIIINAKSDGTVAACILLALAFSLGRRGMLQASVFAGLALGSKYSAPAGLVWVVAVAVLAGRRPRVAWLVPAAILAVPWYLKSWLLTGDPVYPLSGAVLPGVLPGQDPRNAEAWRAWRSRLEVMDRGFLSSLAMGLAGESACFLWVIPFALAERVRRGPLLAALVVYASWYLVMTGFDPPRLGFQVLAGAMALSAGVLSRVVRGRAMKLSLAVVVTVTVASRVTSMFTVGSWNNNPYPYLLGMEDGRGFVRRGITTLADAREHLLLSPAGGSLLMVGEQQGYTLPQPAYQMTPFGGTGVPWFWSAVREAGDERGILKRFHQLNATRLLYNPERAVKNGLYFHGFEWTDGDLGRYARFFGRWMALDYMSPTTHNDQGTFYVYRLRKQAGPAPALLMHLPGTESEFYRRAGLVVMRPPEESLKLHLAALVSMPRVGFYSARAGFAAWRAGEYRMAASLYAPAARTGQLEEALQVVYGACLIRDSRYGEALAVFGRCRAAYPDLSWDVADYTARARCLLAFDLARSDLGAAEKLLADGLAEVQAGPWRARLSGFAGLYRLELAMVRFRQGRRGEGQEEIRRAAGFLPAVADLTPDRLEGYLGWASRMVLERTR